MAEDNNSSAGIETPIGKVNFSGKRTAEFIAILSLTLLGVLAYGFWDHKNDSKDNQKELTSAIKELAAANIQQVKEQRVMNCLLASRQEDRRTMLPECERISR